MLHAHEYEPEVLWKLFPQEAMRQATQTLARIAEITEDKAMYDAREKALRDRQWILNAARNEGKIEGEIEGEIKGEIKGKIEGEIKLLRALQSLSGIPASRDEELVGKSLQDLQSLTDRLQSQLRNRVT